MPDLTAAHRGYEYQDLLVACRLVDMLLGTVAKVDVDQKFFPDDIFDDLTTVSPDGYRERTQFKHSSSNDKLLTLATFTSDARDLRLDRLFTGMLADRAGPGNSATHCLFRVVLRDLPPTDPRLTSILIPPIPDPGPFIPNMRTIRLRFDEQALWAQIHNQSSTGSLSDKNQFAFLANSKVTPSQADLDWVCRHLILELAAPAASGELTNPDAAEHFLLTRVLTDVGAESYPNSHRSAIDVAAAIIGTARAARQKSLVVTANELLRRAQLRSDFGAVSRSHPVDPTVQIPRMTTVQYLAETAAELAATGGQLLIVGPPGQGKSWTCQQLLDELLLRGWLIAEHYCYLGDADNERLERVLAETIFGSLVGRLAEADPRLVTDQRPRYAADEDALISCIGRSLRYEPQRPVALVIDGIDHITRVRSRNDTFDPSLGLASELSSLALPAGSVLIVLSQPGTYLRPFEDTEATSANIPGLNENELRMLATRLGVIPAIDATHNTSSALLEDEDSVAEFLRILADRSAGNALYATYLCREALRHDTILADPAGAMRMFPSFDGTLENYYQHLYTTLGNESGWVSDVIALVDFAVTRTELREIRPDMAHRVDRALDILTPVLIERAAQGGVRIYHESFARFLRRPFQSDHNALIALLDRISSWLKSKGIFRDPRAFRSLLPILAEAGHDAEVVAIAGRDFVVHSVAAGFPVFSINSNLATAIGCAAQIEDWPAVIRYVELSRSADAYQSERYDSTLVNFADVPMALLGPETVAERLLYDDRLVMPARAGLQMCAAVDALGAVAPWRQYLIGFRREAKTDNTSYGKESDQQVNMAWFRGRLRLSASSQTTVPTDEVTVTRVDPIDNDVNDLHDEPSISEQEWDPSMPINWSDLAQAVVKEHLLVSAVVDAILDTHGLSRLTSFIEMLEQPGNLCLALAERIVVGDASDSMGSAQIWATRAAGFGTAPGTAFRLLALGVDLQELSQLSVGEERDRLLSLTRAVQERSIRWESGRLGEWLDACVIASRQDTLGLNTAEALIIGEGWYRCWLHFAIALVRAEAANAMEHSRLAVDAIRQLTLDLNPFSGDPRACDLYPVHGEIETTIRRALSLVDKHEWPEALRLLRQVSNSITTTLQGAVGGPLPPDLLLRLAIESVSPEQRELVATLINDEITHRSGNRYYSDLAEYRLLGARLALASDDRDDATRLWGEACELLTAYGWHKDITIYGLLDSLPTLIAADPARGRTCVARVQPVCERVPLHTDGKETRYAWARWWELLAKADPIALANLVAPRLLRACNEPNELLHGALENLWHEWQTRAHPVVAGTLRLTLDMSLDPGDCDTIAQLADHMDGSTDDSTSHLMTMLLARADERPVQYGYSNDAELIARDDKQVAQLNLVAQSANLPPVISITEATEESAQTHPRTATIRQPTLTAKAPTNVRGPFPIGVTGLARATRAWRTRHSDTSGQGWSVDDFANIIGYRIIELAEAGQEIDATAAIRAIADASSLGDREGVLLALAQGLERHDHHHLATIAYALSWTRTRGHGGWLTFGGETEINSLHGATQLNRTLTLHTIADETQQAVATGRFGTNGITQALIYGFAVGALATSSSSPLDTAFDLWEEAFAVIEKRAPRVHVSDDPEDPYMPSEPDDGMDAPGEMDSAFALGTLAGLAHPGREKKRRGLLAVQFLLSERSLQVASAFDIALATISDPATLTWLLRVIEVHGERSKAVPVRCRQTLIRLTTKPFLTVRTLARRLIDGDKPPLPPPAPADNALIYDALGDLWIPDKDDSEFNEAFGLDEYLSSFAGTRLARAETMLPRLRDAVSARLTSKPNDESYTRRLRAQLDAFADRSERRWPDAFLTPEQTIEETIQVVATGGRSARVISGHPITDPVQWEDELANRLLDDPMLPLMIEGSRVPRPPIPPPPRLGDSIWSAVKIASTMPTQRESIEAALEREGRLYATLSIAPLSAVETVSAGRFHGWRIIATVERRVIRHPDRMSNEDLVAERYRVIEIRSPSDAQTLILLPVATGDIRMWWSTIDGSFRPYSPNKSQPIVGVDDNIMAAGDGHTGIGIPTPLLSPTAPLRAVLGLNPGEPFILDDKVGPALALVTWRAEYDTSEYYLAYPRISGAAIFMRADLFDGLPDTVAGNLVLRDFVAGDSDLSLTDK